MAPRKAATKGRSAVAAPKEQAKSRKRAGATLIEQQEEQDAAVHTAKRSRIRSFEAQVTKALYDNFKGMSEAEINLNLIDGMSLRDRVADAKRRQQQGETVSMGKSFYTALREQYSGEMSASSQLKVRDDQEPEDSRMREALMMMLRHNRDTSAITQWLLFSDLCSQKNFVGLCRGILLVPPSQSIGNAKLVLDFARYVARVSAFRVFEAECRLMKTHIDLALQKSFAHMKSQGVGCSVWWESVRSVGRMLLPEADVDTVLKCSTTWDSVREELKRIQNSCEVGRRMFSAAARQLSENESSAIVQQWVEFINGKDITTVLVAEAREKLKGALQAVGMDVHASFSRRYVEIVYRGVSLRTSVHSLLDEWNLRLEAKIREVAVLSGALPGLWCECELAPRSGASALKVEESLIANAKRMRAAALDFLPTVHDQTSEQIQETITKKQSTLQQIDRYSKIETLFFEAHIGEKAEKRMHTCILACLPCQPNDMRAVLDSKQAMKSLGDGKLFAFCGAGVRASWSAVYAFIQSLSEGKCPAWEQASSSPFWTSTKAAFANFLIVEVPATDDTGAHALRGAPAAQHLMSEFLACKAKDPATKFAYGELSKLTRFGWLLTEQHNAMVQAWLTESLAQTITLTGASSSSGAAKKNSGKQKNKDMSALVGGLFK